MTDFLANLRVCGPFTFVIHAFQLRTRRQMCFAPFPHQHPLRLHPFLRFLPILLAKRNPKLAWLGRVGTVDWRLGTEYPWPGPRFIVCLLYYKLKRNYSTNMPQFASCERTAIALPLLLLPFPSCERSQLLLPVASGQLPFWCCRNQSAKCGPQNCIYLFISEILFPLEVVRRLVVVVVVVVAWDASAAALI